MENSQTNSGCCAICQSKKTPYNCGVCNDSLCKSCVQFLPETAFQFLTNRPSELSHSTYCTVCFDQHVSTPLANYETTLAQAQEILVFDKTQGKETRFVKRLEKPVSVEGVDEQDVTMRLAFIAVEKNYNALVDVDIKAVKVRDGAYQTMAYSAKAIPANVNDRKLMKDRSLWSDPN